MKSVNDLFPPLAGTETTGAPNADLDIFIDGSQSMQGFVAGHDSNYYRILNQFLDNVAAAGFHRNLYQFSSTVRPVTGAMSSVLAPGFYTGADTPLAKLLRLILQSPTHTAIVISDMVQSEKGEDSEALVDALGQVARQRPELRLLGYRSDFNGKYFSESSHGRAFQLQASQASAFTGRPFYILVVAPNAEEMDRVQKYLLNRAPTPYSFDPTAPSFTVTKVALSKGQEQTWHIRSKFVPGSGGVQRFTMGFQAERNQPAGSSQALALDVSYAEGIPLLSAGRLGTETEMSTWTSTFAPVNPVALPLEGDQGPPAGVMHLVLSVRQPAPGSTDVYRILTRPGDANLEAPQWLADWSTEDDSAPSSGNKTYHLGLLAQTMTEQIAEKRLCGDWIFSVRGKD